MDLHVTRGSTCGHLAICHEILYGNRSTRVEALRGVICNTMGRKKNSKKDDTKRFKAELATEQALSQCACCDTGWENAVDALQGHLEWIDQLLIEKRNLREDMRILSDHMESNILKDKKALEMLQSILTRLES